MTYQVKLTRGAEDDVLRLFVYLLEKESNWAGGGDFAIADRAIAAIQDGLATLQRSPFTCRKAAQSPFLREWMIPFGATG